jgi:hypothetical protein
MDRPTDWPQWVNANELQEQIEAVRRSVIKGQPYGSAPWVEPLSPRALQNLVHDANRL